MNQNQLSNYKTCAVCGSQSDLDFHHWDYLTDTGIEVCRECHDTLHSGEVARPSDGRGDQWLWQAVGNLVEAHLAAGHPPDSELICEKYNLSKENIGIVGRAIVELGEVDRDSREST